MTVLLVCRALTPSWRRGPSIALAAAYGLPATACWALLAYHVASQCAEMVRLLEVASCQLEALRATLALAQDQYMLEQTEAVGAAWAARGVK